MPKNPRSQAIDLLPEPVSPVMRGKAGKSERNDIMQNKPQEELTREEAALAAEGVRLLLDLVNSCRDKTDGHCLLGAFAADYQELASGKLHQWPCCNGGSCNFSRAGRLKRGAMRIKPTAMIILLATTFAACPSAHADAVYLHIDTTANNYCSREFGGEWILTNNTSRTVNVVLRQFYTNDGTTSVDNNVRVTLGPTQSTSFGCSKWIQGHVGSQAFSILQVDGPSQPGNSPKPPPTSVAAPPAPPPPPPRPFPDNDSTFKYLGSNGFSRGGGGTGRTDVMLWEIALDPGMEIDTSYQQAAETRGWPFVSHIGGATSPLTVDQIPHGFLVKVGGSNYLSVRDPQTGPPLTINLPTVSFNGSFFPTLSSSPFPLTGGWPVFKMTLYCGPPAHAPCDVNVKVWVKQRPKSVQPAS